MAQVSGIPKRSLPVRKSEGSNPSVVKYSKRFFSLNYICISLKLYPVMDFFIDTYHIVLLETRIRMLMRDIPPAFWTQSRKCNRISLEYSLRSCCNASISVCMCLLVRTLYTNNYVHFISLFCQPDSKHWKEFQPEIVCT